MFFFFKQKTAYEMRISDWSSDVCSSDLRKVKPGGVLFVHSYNKSFTCMMSYKYKYRWITKRFPAEKVKDLLDRFGPTLFSINEKMAHGGRLARLLARNFVPFQLIAPPSSHRRHGDAEQTGRASCRER